MSLINPKGGYFSIMNDNWREFYSVLLKFGWVSNFICLKLFIVINLKIEIAEPLKTNGNNNEKFTNETITQIR